jgi:FemAB-related protein (PEP-CTERM system-associated)
MKTAVKLDRPVQAAAAFSIRTLDAQRVADWNRFVDNCPEASFFHLAQWQQVIEPVFGHRAHFLYAERDGDIEGVIVLGHVKSRLLGNALISPPFFVYGGAAAANDEARGALEDAAEALALQLKVDYLELRNRSHRREGWLTKDLYVTFRKTIDPDPEKNLLAIPRKQRAMVRKGIEAGLQSRVDEHVDDFYEVFAASYRNLGTPVFPKKLFRTLKQVFGDACEIMSIITPDGRVVASVMSFYFRDEVLPYYAGSIPEARDLKAHDFMYWELMRRACLRGIRVFDYGRSKQGTGSYSFKKNWGFEPEPLSYQYRLVKAQSMPDINPMNPKYRLFVSLWQRLPLPVSKIIGPMIARNLG